MTAYQIAPDLDDDEALALYPIGPIDPTANPIATVHLASAAPMLAAAPLMLAALEIARIGANDIGPAGARAYVITTIEAAIAAATATPIPADLAQASDSHTCAVCRRPEADCSAAPYPDVIGDRGEGQAILTNHYTCPECGTDWQDEWSCAVDDDCPNCGARHISPHESQEN